MKFKGSVKAVKNYVVNDKPVYKDGEIVNPDPANSKVIGSMHFNGYNFEVTKYNTGERHEGYAARKVIGS